jgi:hypothetical protein
MRCAASPTRQKRVALQRRWGLPAVDGVDDRLMGAQGVGAVGDLALEVLRQRGCQRQPLQRVADGGQVNQLVQQRAQPRLVQHIVAHPRAAQAHIQQCGGRQVVIRREQVGVPHIGLRLGGQDGREVQSVQKRRAPLGAVGQRERAVCTCVPQLRALCEHALRLPAEPQREDALVVIGLPPLGDSVRLFV